MPKPMRRSATQRSTSGFSRVKGAESRRNRLLKRALLCGVVGQQFQRDLLAAVAPPD